MDSARIALFEDQPSQRQLFNIAAAAAGHRVVAEAQTREEALGVVDQIATGKLAVDIVVLDGNLNSGPQDGEDARQIRAAMRTKNVGAFIIGFSGNSAIANKVEVDIDTGKDVLAAVRAITNLPEQTRSSGQDLRPKSRFYHPNEMPFSP